MYFRFDRYKKIEQPQLILCEISRKRLGELDAKDMTMELGFTNISEVHFNVPSLRIDGSNSPLYDAIRELRMVEVRDFGWFQLRTIAERYDYDGKAYKECTVYSAECMLQGKQVINLEGEYKLYDPRL